MSVVCFVILWQKLTSYKKKAMTLLKIEALWRVQNFNGAKRKIGAVLDTRAGLNLLVEDCLPRAWAKNAVPKKMAHLRFATDTQLEVRKVKQLEVQFVQRVGEVSLFFWRGGGGAQFVSDTIFRTAYVDDNIGNIGSEKCTVMATGSRLVAIEENVGSALYIANNVTTKQQHHEKRCRGYRCFVAYCMVIQSINKVQMYVKNNFGGVRLVIFHKNLVRNR